MKSRSPTSVRLMSERMAITVTISVHMNADYDEIHSF
jgi:hypothetical protein